MWHWPLASADRVAICPVTGEQPSRSFPLLSDLLLLSVVLAVSRPLHTPPAESAESVYGRSHHVRSPREVIDIPRDAGWIMNCLMFFNPAIPDATGNGRRACGMRNTGIGASVKLEILWEDSGQDSTKHVAGCAVRARTNTQVRPTDQLCDGNQLIRKVNSNERHASEDLRQGPDPS